MSGRRVVITGRAVTSSLGDDLPTVISAWRSGSSCFAQDLSLPNHPQAQHYVGLCPQPNLSLLSDKKVQKAVTRKDLIGIVTALAAAKDAGITAKGEIAPERFGMFVGAGSTQLGDLHPYRDLIERCVDGGVFDAKRFGEEMMSRVSPMVMLQTLMNNTLCYASIALDIRGVNANFMDFQVAGLRALHEAMQAVRSGRADVVLVGGVAGKPEPYLASEGLKVGYLARTNWSDGEPSKVIRPFDAKRSGTILSEGAAFLVVEDEAHAIQRGATIYGRLSDVAFSSEGGFAYLDAKPSVALESCLGATLAQDGFDKSQLSFVMAHANGSIDGDRVEAAAFGKVLGRKTLDVAFHSSKPCFGETTEAAPILDIILALDVLNFGRLPTTKNYDYGDEHTADLLVTKEDADILGGIGLVSARSFSGICASVGVTNLV